MRGRGGQPEAYCHRAKLDAVRYALAIVKRSDDRKGFVVPPKRWIVERTNAWLMRTRRLGTRLRTPRHQRRGDRLLVDEPAHDPPPGPATPFPSMNRPGRGSAGQPRATRRFAFDRKPSTRAGTTSIPNAAAISWQVRGT
ncbi:hypothetical protein SBRY_50280 [Actinacidiphila bryophytorum]|uniref:Transposase n=1 Tax=Actinacidiphila bryophytorum TaxID=1436133 RepID=A0A9W4H4H0_9ACTN|nr:hypothetical protein SBRY_50280 [Actinacidiphila bryophytorum]